MTRKIRKDGGVRLSVRVAPERLEDVRRRYGLSAQTTSKD
jgi:hypothetical protein